MLCSPAFAGMRVVTGALVSVNGVLIMPAPRVIGRVK